MPDTVADLRPEIQAGLRALALDPGLAPPMLAYLALLARWNRTYNLTAVRDPREMVSKHLLDSLAMHAATAPIAATGGHLADLGTGAGFPGIPLAIVLPNLRVALNDATQKKCRFLEHVVTAFLLWAVVLFIASRRRDRAAGTVYPAGTLRGNVLTVAIGVAAWAAFALWLHLWLIGVDPMA